MTQPFPLPLLAGVDTYYIPQLGATSYTAPAVHFDAVTNLTSAVGFGSPTCISFSFWFNMPSYNAEVHNSDFWFFQFQNHDNSDQFGYGISGQDDWAAAQQFFNYWADANGSAEWISSRLPPFYSVPNLINNQWHHILCTIRSDGQVVTYIDDQRVGFPPQTGEESWPPGTLIDLQGILTLPIEAGSGQEFDMSDVWIAPGVDLTNSDSLIPEATRRQFISPTCQPVDPSNFPPASIILSGDTSTFGTNQGTGPELTVTGTLTDSVGGSPSSGARVQINGLIGGQYTILTDATDWTGTNVYFLNPTYGFNVTRATYNSSEYNTLFIPPGSLVVQMYGPTPIDVAITRCQNTLVTTQPLNLLITEDTVFQFGGGCGTNGTFASATCADWNSSSVTLEIQHPNGTWLSVAPPFTSNAQAGLGLCAGTCRVRGVADLNAPLAFSICAINMNSSGGFIGVNLTEPSDSFSLSGGVYGIATSCSDSTNLTINRYMADGSVLPYQFTQNSASLPYLASGTWAIDPTDLSGPVSLSLTPTTLASPPQCLTLNGITEDTEFELEGCPLEWQIALSCADWNSATVTMQFQTPDGTWIGVNGNTMTATANAMLFPTSPAGRYRFTGVADLNAPLYVGMGNTPCVVKDTVSFVNITTAVEFSLAGGQYAMGFYSHDNGGSLWNLNFQAPDGTWVLIAPNGDGPQVFWQWWSPGRYQIDPSALDNPLSVYLAAMPL